MRMLALAVLALLLASCARQSTAEQLVNRLYENDPARKNIGREISGYSFTGIAGENPSWRIIGKPVIYETFFVDCPGCVEMIQHYTQLYREHPGEFEVVLLDIKESDSEEYILSLKERLDAPDWLWVPYSAEVRRFMDDFKVLAADTTYLVDREREVVYADSLLANERVTEALLKVI